ncbi:hypothetical protein [Roseiarcus sp.]|uniref:hypothetical protein n=1 Tax=Roseiarcus sp. TaxID=1969460 RepID=UPI003F9E7EA9
MSHLRLILTAAAAVGLLSSTASAQTIATIDGHYYKLVPLKRPSPNAEVVTVVPNEATASVPASASCRVTTFQNGEYDPEWVTMCGPP